MAATYSLLCLVPLVQGAVAVEVRCGDVCHPGTGWRGDPDAWQWLPLAALGAAVFAAAIVLLAGLLRRSRRLTRAALVISVGCWCGLSALALSSP